MSDMIPSTPDENEPRRKKVRPTKSDETRSDHQRKRRDKTNRSSRQAIASDEDCLNALSKMPGLVAMGVLTTAQANSIRGVYSTILGYHQKARNARSVQTLDNDNVLEILRQNPEMISMVESLLTDEQVEMLMNDATDGEDEES